jgi:ribonuclease PH
VERKQKRNIDRRLQEMEAIVVDTFSSVIMLDLYAKSEVHIVVHVLESDGYDLSADYMSSYVVSGQLYVL